MEQNDSKFELYAIVIKGIIETFVRLEWSLRMR